MRVCVRAGACAPSLFLCFVRAYSPPRCFRACVRARARVCLSVLPRATQNASLAGDASAPAYRQHLTGALNYNSKAHFYAPVGGQPQQRGPAFARAYDPGRVRRVLVGATSAASACTSASASASPAIGTDSDTGTDSADVSGGGGAGGSDQADGDASASVAALPHECLPEIDVRSAPTRFCVLLFYDFSLSRDVNCLRACTAPRTAPHLVGERPHRVAGPHAHGALCGARAHAHADADADAPLALALALGFL